MYKRQINDFYDEYLDNDPVTYYDGDLAPTDQRSSDSDTCALCATFQHDASYHDAPPAPTDAVT